ncbi:hypothetical protein HanRHA438_Chr12g0561661 [Helianthus annuus]|nr:hypothetical protein HanRHA438_Chr12g0561661 [Helianthus annuus]
MKPLLWKWQCVRMRTIATRRRRVRRLLRRRPCGSSVFLAGNRRYPCREDHHALTTSYGSSPPHRRRAWRWIPRRRRVHTRRCIKPAGRVFLRRGENTAWTRGFSAGFLTGTASFSAWFTKSAFSNM